MRFAERGAMRQLLFVLFVLPIAGCIGGSTTAPIGPTPPVSASGTWSGNVITQSQVTHMTWTLTQTRSIVGGPVTITGVGGAVMLSGTLSGTLNGSTITYSVTVPPGGVAGAASCAARLDGTGTISEGAPSVLKGTYATTTGACASAFSKALFTLVSGPAATAIGSNTSS